MSARFETYISSVDEPADRRFVLVVYQEGRGNFQVTRSLQSESRAMSYLVKTDGSSLFEAKEQILNTVPQALEQVFIEGALTISYVEGDVLVEFPVEYASKFEKLKLQEIAELSIRGLSPFTKEFAEPLFLLDKYFADSDATVSSSQLCVFVVFAISLLLLFYRSSILPLEWLQFTGYCLIASSLLGVIFLKFSKSLFRTGKVFALCFFGACAVLLMLLVGIASREILNKPSIVREGIVESLLEGTTSNQMRIRLASDPNTTYLISKEYLKERPERLPQAIRITIQPGLFGLRYVRGVDNLR